MDHMTVVLYFFIEIDLYVVSITAQVVAGEVYQHHMFGILFRVCKQCFGTLFIQGYISGTESCSGDRVDTGMTVRHFAMRFRRGTEDTEAAEVEIEQVRRRVDTSQCTIYFEIIPFERLFETTAEYDLEDIAA